MGKVIIVHTQGPDDPVQCGAPFLYAQDAAAQVYATEIFFTTRGTALLKKGVAETVFPKMGGRSIKQFIEETIAKGVRLVVCAPSLALNDMTEDDLIDQADNLVGTAYLIKQGLEADLVLTF
jgi:predicted peroxiredoxin